MVGLVAGPVVGGCVRRQRAPVICCQIDLGPNCSSTRQSASLRCSSPSSYAARSRAGVLEMITGGAISPSCRPMTGLISAFGPDPQAHNCVARRHITAPSRQCLIVGLYEVRGNTVATSDFAASPLPTCLIGRRGSVQFSLGSGRMIGRRARRGGKRGKVWSYRRGAAAPAGARAMPLATRLIWDSRKFHRS